ncbi:hypothetical protein NDU88_008893 [Pleurodeles waltl]|uniref:Uncharacterized protein n=1 Tax=Pleurodeles waltl TaxID=8319 RepID=A0AAV7PQH0_PLEWA|nr:hypothetical protein NDU88_008893 [Pleurodeles waltl]
MLARLARQDKRQRWVHKIHTATGECKRNNKGILKILGNLYSFHSRVQMEEIRKFVTDISTLRLADSHRVTLEAPTETRETLDATGQMLKKGKPVADCRSSRTPTLHKRPARAEKDESSTWGPRGAPRESEGRDPVQGLLEGDGGGKAACSWRWRLARVPYPADGVGRPAGLQPSDGGGDSPGLRAPEVVVSGARDAHGRRKGAHSRCVAWARGPERADISCRTACRGPEELVAQCLATQRCGEQVAPRARRAVPIR